MLVIKTAINATQKDDIPVKIAKCNSDKIEPYLNRLTKIGFSCNPYLSLLVSAAAANFFLEGEAQEE